MRIVKRIIITLIVLGVLVFGASATLIYLKQDNLEQIVIEEINKQLISEILVEDISFSAIKNFPYVSVEFDNLTIIDAFQEDTLCKLDEVNVKFNALDLYNKIYLIQEISLANGYVSIYYKDGRPNYEIWNTESDTIESESIDFGLENVALNNVKINYVDDGLVSSFMNKETRLQLNIEDSETYIDINAQLLNEKLLLNNINHFPNENINLNTKMSIDSSGLDITTDLSVKDIPFNLDINQTNKTLKVYVIAKEFDVVSILDILPKEYLSAIEDYDISGKSSFKLAYISDQQKEAGIDVDFTFKNGTIKSDVIPFDLQQLSLNGKYTNGSKRTDETTLIDLKDIQLIANNEPILANATINGLENPKIKADVSSQLKLSELEKWGYKSDFKSIDGIATYEVIYHGNVGVKNNIDYDIAMAKKSADIFIENLSLKVDEQIPKLSNSTIKLKVINDHIDIERLEGTLAEESKFKFVGAIENVFSYLFLKNSPLKIAGEFNSKWMIFDELMQVDSTSEGNTNEVKAVELPEDIIANVKFNLDDFTYDRFHMRNFHSSIKYKNKKLNVNNIELETMSGKITSNLTFEQLRSGKMRLISTTLLDNINVRQLFYEFHNFGQNTMRHKHLKGKIDSEIYLRNEWDKYFTPIDNHLYSFIDVNINNGELLEFEPLMEMSDYISVNELKRIKFSNLENQIEIKNNKIEIPFMEIYSSALDMAGSGSHTFDNEMDYEFKILLNEILGNKFKRKHKKKVSEFGVIEDDGIKGMTLFLKMKGSVDNPEISYNTLKLRESLDKGFKKEKKKLKDVVKSEFGDKPSEQQIEDKPDYDSIIEWEE
ncbi:MAG: hypothetical protein ISR00_00035 [Flavobacteriales bacterium]|nr:hypothetical protein [Flavobacteriales bacterium]MBL6872320.1 hypothetical protein [Flavobacteriales bacterium]